MEQGKLQHQEDSGTIMILKRNTCNLRRNGGALEIQRILCQTISVRVVGSIPTRNSGLWHYSKHMIEFTQLVYNSNIICNCIVINTLTADYEITRRLCSLPEGQTTSYHVLTHIKKSTCRFLSSFLKTVAAVKVLINK